MAKKDRAVSSLVEMVEAITTCGLTKDEAFRFECATRIMMKSKGGRKKIACAINIHPDYFEGVYQDAIYRKRQRESRRRVKHI